jgi:hypothetical protein
MKSLYRRPEQRPGHRETLDFRRDVVCGRRVRCRLRHPRRHADWQNPPAPGLPFASSALDRLSELDVDRDCPESVSTQLQRSKQPSSNTAGREPPPLRLSSAIASPPRVASTVPARRRDRPPTVPRSNEPSQPRAGDLVEPPGNRPRGAPPRPSRGAREIWRYPGSRSTARVNAGSAWAPRNLRLARPHRGATRGLPRDDTMISRGSCKGEGC